MLGWKAYFGLSQTPKVWRTLDEWLRHRMRAIQLKHWKTKRTAVIRLIRLGVNTKTAWGSVYGGRKSIWALSHCSAVDRGLRNAYFAERGLVSVLDRWRLKQPVIVAPGPQPVAPG